MKMIVSTAQYIICTHIVWKLSATNWKIQTVVMLLPLNFPIEICGNFLSVPHFTYVFIFCVIVPVKAVEESISSYCFGLVP